MRGIQYAESYEVAFHFPLSITHLLSVMIRVPMEQTRLQRDAGFVLQAPLLIMCSINITIFQLVLNMHAISQPN